MIFLGASIAQLSGDDDTGADRSFAHRLNLLGRMCPCGFWTMSLMM
jgi:hypothetical protein